MAFSSSDDNVIAVSLEVVLEQIDAESSLENENWSRALDNSSTRMVVLFSNEDIVILYRIRSEVVCAVLFMWIVL